MIKIYRNLHHTNAFSIRKDGRVIARLTDPFIAYNIEFRVNEGGRQRVLREKQKNVHAFVVASLLHPGESDRLLVPITYNPYEAGEFICAGNPIHQAGAVQFRDGKCFLIT